MFRYRLSEAAQGDILDVVAWTHEQFDEVVRLRYESLIVVTLRDVASQPDRAAWRDPNSAQALGPGTCN